MPPHDVWPARLIAERAIAPRRPVEDDALAVADLVATTLGRPQLTWHVGPEPPHELRPEDAAADLRAGRDAGVPALLADHPTDWDLLLAAQESPVDGVQYLDLALPGSRAPQWLPVIPMMRLVRAVAEQFAAAVAVTEDSALQRAFLRDRPERLVAARLEELGQTAPVPPSPQPSGLVHGVLPELRHPVEFERTAVPHAVYWVNWWSADVVAALGADRVRSAGWAHVDEAPDGSVTAATGDAPPDLGDPDQMARLAEVVDRLGLRAAQDRRPTDRALPG